MTEPEQRVAINDGVRLQYRCEGDGEPVAFVPTAGYGPWQWAWQFPAVAGPFQAITYHGRETGESDAPPGPYDVPTLADDLEAVLADAEARRAHLVGFGLGGMVALEHAHRYGRARSIALIGTTPGGPEAVRPTPLDEALAAPRDDPDALRASLEPALSAEFRDAHPDVLDGIVEWRAAEDADRDGWAAGAAAFADYERGWPLYELSLPALIAHGGADEIVPPENADVLTAGLPRSESVRYEDSGHLVTVERSRPLNDELLAFLDEHVESDH